MGMVAFAAAAVVAGSVEAVGTVHKLQWLGRVLQKELMVTLPGANDSLLQSSLIKAKTVSTGLLDCRGVAFSRCFI